MSDVLSVEVVPTGKALGAEIVGVDLRKLSADAFARIAKAYADHLVVLIRGQDLSDPDLIAFGKRFGELEPPGMSIIGKPYLDDYPDVLVISNLKSEDGMPLGNLGDGEAIWHTDMSYRETPVSAAILHAWEVPPSGGDTSFANQYLAYETLPGDLHDKIEGRIMVHDETYNSAGQLRKGFGEVTDPRDAPGARHPIVRTHPVTGRKCLYLGRRRNGCILGLDLDDSEETLDRLWAHASQPSLTWTHRWQKGDVLIWDNRCVLHRRDSFDPASRRMMHRVQIKGERPA
jgi:alpha-ketoglutarate-dependent taurine dioxygenase